MTTASTNWVLTKAHRDFSRGLVRFANLKVNNAALADDLVQDTFLKTLKYLQSNGKIDLMRAFLYHVLNRLIIDEYRLPFMEGWLLYKKWMFVPSHQTMVSVFLCRAGWAIFFICPSMGYPVMLCSQWRHQVYGSHKKRTIRHRVGRAHVAGKLDLHKDRRRYRDRSFFDTR